MGTSERRVDLVFEGGGVKGIALAGAFAELEARGFRPQCVPGTSAGAITAARVAAGCPGRAIERIVTQDMHFPSFEDPPRLHEFGVLGDAMDIARRKGMHSKRLFPGVYRGEAERARSDSVWSAQGCWGKRRTATVHAPSDRLRLERPQRARSPEGRDAARCRSRSAVRGRSGAHEHVNPDLFEQVIHQNPRSGGQHMIVDGGMLSNFPVWLFDSTPLKPSFPTFGVQLVAPLTKVTDGRAQGAAALPLPSFIDYLKSLADTATQAHDRFYLEDDDFARTIAISTLGVRTTEFQISPDRVAALIQSGHEATDKFLLTWDFDAWVETYRSGDRAPASPQSHAEPT